MHSKAYAGETDTLWNLKRNAKLESAWHYKDASKYLLGGTSEVYFHASRLSCQQVVLKTSV